ncbi:MAG: hypothetical protein LBI29_00390 [Rickettsiales bacterium]|jgi:transposase-like protein|nr:hypothetical protein [Rickettsiales bacterium]
MCVEGIKCVHRESERINMSGIVDGGKQRYYCRDYGRTFGGGSDRRIKYSDEKRLRVLKLYLDNVGLGSIERLENVSVALVPEWFKKFAKIPNSAVNT